MKIRFAVLGTAILASAAAVASFGAYLKYEIIKPLNLPDYSEKSIFELPFVYYSDEVLQFMVDNADLLMGTEPPKTDPPETKPSQPTEPSETAPPQTDPPTEPSETLPTDSFDPTQPSETEPPTTPPTTVPPTTAPPPTEPTYPPEEPNFNFPSAPVDSSWFDNVLFIGDSRVVGLRSYARNGNADYFADVGMTVFSANSKVLSDKNFPEMKLEQLLATKQYDKIYIAFGLNEAGYNFNAFKLKFTALYNQIRAAQPNAVIILQSVMSVTPKQAAKADYFSPTYLQKMSDHIASHANGTDTFYVDVNEYFADSRGYMFTSLTNDGYHPTGSGYRRWRDWIAYVVGTLGV